MNRRFDSFFMSRRTGQLRAWLGLPLLGLLPLASQAAAAEASAASATPAAATASTAVSPAAAAKTATPVAATAGALAYEQELAAWKQERAQRLTAADGWLTVVGRQELHPGANRLGSASDNDVMVAKLPAHLGVVTVEPLREKVTVELLPDTGAQLDGRSVAHGEIKTDKVAKQSELKVGTLSLFVIQRGPKYILRVKDSESEGRLHFAGLEYFPVDPSWRIEARWVAFEKPLRILVNNVIGQTNEEEAPGKAVFERDGKTYELYPTYEDDGTLFFVLRDATSGEETYAASRFLHADPAKDGKVILDFNRLVNPPCAFTAFATCPLPIKENILPLPIRAGEKTYKGKH